LITHNTRDFQRHEIASFFRIPEHMLGFQDRTSSWGTGIEQMEIGFVINTLRPWLNRIETYMSNLLPPNQVCKFNLQGRLRGDTLQRYQAYTLGINGGWLCVDDVRELEDQPALPDGKGQIFYRPLNFASSDAFLPDAPGFGNPGGSSGGIGGGVGNSPTAPPAPPPPGSDDF
jgi:phage portal protein BeeE